MEELKNSLEEAGIVSEFTELSINSENYIIDIRMENGYYEITVYVRLPENQVDFSHDAQFEDVDDVVNYIQSID